MTNSLDYATLFVLFALSSFMFALSEYFLNQRKETAMICPDCKGTGNAPNPNHGNCESPWMDCPVCSGTGKLLDGAGHEGNRRKPLTAALVTGMTGGLTSGPVTFPGDNIREFLEEVNARWDDIDGALTWFYANKDALSSIVKMVHENEASIQAIIKAAGKISAFVDTLLAKEKADLDPKRTVGPRILRETT